jgi:hypothetical protein
MELGGMMQLTRFELCEVDREIRAVLWLLGPGTVARTKALQTPDDIRRILVLRNWHP